MAETGAGPTAMLGASAAYFAGAACVSALMCWVYIRLAHRYGWGQQVRTDGPQAHLHKQGTPSMGGLVFFALALACGAVVSTGTAGSVELALWGLMTAGGGMAVLGLIDDMAKLAAHRSTGIRARWRIIGQVAVAAGAVTLINRAWQSSTAEPQTTWLGLNALGEPFRSTLQVMAVMGCANAVNFTDGVDGLAAGTAAIATLALLVAATWLPQEPLQTASAVFPLTAVVAGACAGFLIWNWHPARLFMGDVGSMLIGGTLGAAAVALRLELLLVILGGIFVLETLSVMAQVVSFRLTGKRILKMAPLHHHLELCGWSEVKVVLVAYAVQIALAAVSVALMEHTLAS